MFSFAGFRSPWLAALLALLLFSTACASLRGARLYQRGTRALDRGDWVTAIDDLERAAELAPGASEIHNNLGIAYIGVRRFDAARAAWQRAVDLDCGNDAARLNLRRARVFDAQRVKLDPAMAVGPKGAGK